MKKLIIIIGILILTGLISILIVNQNNDLEKDINKQAIVNRESVIPSNAVKVPPETDLNPPKSDSDEYHDPVPLPYAINTAGGEDSAFIMPDGKTLYFWFTPDVNIPSEKQIIDGVSGIYVSHKYGDNWDKPERILLNEPKKISFDGCTYVSEDNTIWTCSAREGYSCPEYSGGLCWFKADLDLTINKGLNPEKVDLSDDWEVGELCIHENKLYYHSKKQGGKGGMDIWVLSKDALGNWADPQNININTERDEGFPAISPNGQELWFSRDFAVWRSKNINGEWAEPEKNVFPLAGEPSIDVHGNIYFTHHFFEQDKMIEADIYVAYKK